MTSFEEAFQRVSQLADEFAADEKFHLSPQFQEAEVRKYFIDKFFKALGWDVDHDLQQNPRMREVRIEKNSDTFSTRKADYAFYLRPNFDRPVFLVEAKKPSVNLANPDSYFQTIRYGFNTSTSVAILTDFEEFHVLDCRREPERVEGIVMYAQLKTFNYKEYKDREKFEWIYWRFSREAVEAGNLKKYWKELPRPKGKSKQLKLINDQLAPIDDNFLARLDEYRQTLASEIFKTNKLLSAQDLTEAAQKILDRLVFMRFLEDNLLETQSIVESFSGKGKAWGRFVMTSEWLDKIYNGVVFKEDFIDRPKLNPPNDDKFFQICQSFGHQDSPYLFSYIPVEILGSIYERFLGKIVAKKGTGITIIPKPEYRRAEGVYYTPKYVVDYIVKNTVGKLLESKTPNQVSELRFADIACGSGSFLIGVYGTIIEYLEDWYNAHPDEAVKPQKPESKKAKGQPRCRLTEDGRYVLTLSEKRKVLRENIYGVDIDPQAVEVAQFSLFLKLLEHETTASREAAQTELQLGSALGKAILPDMSKNIVCGNSLVEYDIEQQFSLTPEEEKSIKPFSFNSTFREIMSRGGFDAIVGNPPYGMFEDDLLKKYSEKRYISAEGRYDRFELFIERSLSLLQQNGKFGYIVPTPILTNVYSRRIRQHIIENSKIEEIANFAMSVFSDPTVHSCIIILTKEQPSVEYEIDIKRKINLPEELLALPDSRISNYEINSDKNFVIDIFIGPEHKQLLKKMNSDSQLLGDLAYIRQCIKTGDDSAYVAKSERLKPRPWKSTLRGRSIERYGTVEKDLYLKYGDWLARNWQNKTFYETPKIAIRETGSRIVATLDLEERYFLSSLYAVYFKTGNSEENLKLLLALLNSKLCTFFINLIAFAATEGAFTKIRTNQLARFPIKNLDSPSDVQKTLANTLVRNVDQMLDTKKNLLIPQRDFDHERLIQKCNYLDVEIDRLVYELYGLTQEEIKVVEGS